MWSIDCFIPSDKQFPVNSWSYSKPHFILEDLHNTLGRPASGIVEVAIGTPFSKKLFRFTDLNEAVSRVKLWMTFS